MAGASNKTAFLEGMANAVPFLFVIVPFAFLFGVVAAEAGLHLVETFVFSMLVVAGAAQLTALSMLADHAPVYLAVAAALAVNLRMAMYSAALTPWLGGARLRTRVLIAYCLFDQPYALAAVKYDERPAWGLGERVRYYFGAVAVIMPAWFLLSTLGALVGQTIPDWLALDFAMPIAFIALVAPMLRTIAHVAAAFTSIVGALALAWLPTGVGLLLAAVLAMMAGAQVEQWMERRKAEVRP